MIFVILLALLTSFGTPTEHETPTLEITVSQGEYDHAITHWYDTRQRLAVFGTDKHFVFSNFGGPFASATIRVTKTSEYEIYCRGDDITWKEKSDEELVIALQAHDERARLAYQCRMLEKLLALSDMYDMYASPAAQSPEHVGPQDLLPLVRSVDPEVTPVSLER
ncbi:MAG: hypothetical protein KBD16_00010 [Candidatus Pacebacteria bacterium]|nr:hypothetical protein [Candidatus Paceibacterota bacterium]